MNELRRDLLLAQTAIAAQEVRVELVLKENDDLHQRIEETLDHINALELEIEKWAQQSPVPAFEAVASVFRSRVAELEQELKALRSVEGK